MKIMQAVEFEAEIENGMIKIPEPYQALLNSKHVHIIIMFDEENTTAYHSDSDASLSP